MNCFRTEVQAGSQPHMLDVACFRIIALARSKLKLQVTVIGVTQISADDCGIPHAKSQIINPKSSMKWAPRGSNPGHPD